MVNGAPGPYSDWVIVLLGSRTLVGKPTGVAVQLLSPVFQLEVGMQRTQQGIAIMMAAMPICMLPSFDSLDLPHGSAVKPLSELSRDDRRQVEDAIRKAVEATANMRAEQAGLLIAPTGVKLPEPPR